LLETKLQLIKKRLNVFKSNERMMKENKKGSKTTFQNK